MPARDAYHDQVRHALERDGWTITHDPLRLKVRRRRLYVDLGAERVLAAEKGLRKKIAIEIKTFDGPSDVRDLEDARPPTCGSRCQGPGSTPTRTSRSCAAEPLFDDEVRDTLLNPTVLFEVLSDSTESYDRGKKFRHDRSIASLREYVLVAQDAASVERFTRGSDGVWSLHESGPGERLVLASIDCELAVDEIYLKVFPATEPRT